MRRGTSRLRWRRGSFALSTSALVYAFALPTAAQAQCAPDPTVADATTTCTGIDPDGLVVTTPGTTVSVTGTVLSDGSAPAITLQQSPTNLYSYGLTIDVAGNVDGGGQSGIGLFGASSRFSSGLAELQLNVAAGATVSGTIALVFGLAPGATFANISAVVDNAGSLTGTGGIALDGDLVGSPYGYLLSFGGVSQITNRASAVIAGSIVGPVGRLDNAGLIDASIGSAVKPGNALNRFPSPFSTGQWTNSGTIRSADAAPTIQSYLLFDLANSGTIANSGTGPAISASSLTLTNAAGGIISTAGPTAIQSFNSLTLVNAGTINGDVIGGPRTASSIRRKG